MSSASLLVEGTRIATFDLTGSTVDSATTYTLGQSFDTEAKKDK